MAPRTVSILVAELAGSAADTVRREHLEGVRVVVEAHGGRVVNGSDERVTAVFQSAAAAADAGVAILGCTDDLALRRGVSLAVGVGIAAGEASSDGEHWFGAPVVEATQLCAAAGPHQVLASDVFRNLGGLPEMVEVRPAAARARWTGRGQPCRAR